MKKKSLRKRHYSVLPLLLFGATMIMALFVILALSFTKNTREVTTIKAEGDPNPKGSPAWCADHCNPSPETNPCNQDSSYKSPDCCNEVSQSGDPNACAWPDRGYCTDSQCSSIPEGTPRARCGGPKHSWCGECTTGNCPGFGAKPTPSAAPTIKPIEPTSQPTLEPTVAPKIPVITTPQPTTKIRVPPNEIQPVITNAFQNPKPTTVTQQFDFPFIQLPSITFPKVKVNLIRANQIARKPLGFFEYIFGRIVYYDKLLENTINDKIKTIIK